MHEHESSEANVSPVIGPPVAYCTKCEHVKFSFDEPCRCVMFPYPREPRNLVELTVPSCNVASLAADLHM